MRELVGQGKPFYSSLDKAAGLLRRKVGTGSEFLKELMSIPGVKQAEIAERGLGELLNAPKMTHEQFMAALGEKPAPAIKERILADDGTKFSKQAYDESAHEEYTLPGGENYREMLIKAPKPKYSQNKIMELEAKLRRAPPDKVEHYTALLNKMKKISGQNEQFPGVPHHFGGEPGILASMRLKDRTAPGDMGYTLVNKKSGNKSQHYNTIEEAQAALQGMPEEMRPSLDIKPSRGPEKKLLHLEELQSDWHQTGREKGYRKPGKPEKLKGEPYQLDDGTYGVRWEDGSVSGLGWGRDSAVRIAAQGKFPGDVPDAPFKKNWEEMALKRLIHHAAENGYHGVVVTPGQEQADRYGLSKHIDSLELFPSFSSDGEKPFRLRGNKNNNPIMTKDVDESDLPELIGDDLAKKLLSTKEDPFGFKTLSGVDLETDKRAKGMKQFYDTKVPNILNSIGKKYGAKTELGGHKLPGDPSQRGDASERLGLAGERFSDMSPEQIQAFNQKLDDANAKQLHYFPITEEMRQDVKKNGIPLYESGGTVSTQ